MTGAPRLATSLSHRLPRDASSPDEIDALRRRALIEQDVAAIDLRKIADPWTRQVIRNEAERQLGLRR